jgi:molybdopterin adenylyltransferase
MRVAVLTVSDRAARRERPDASGPAVRERLERAAYRVVEMAVVPDEVPEIETVLRRWADGGEIDVVLTTGGTGIAERDRTPEATLAVCDRTVPGIGEAMRHAGLAKTPHAMLSRGVAGVRGQTLIVNLPGSPRAAVESLEAVLPALPHSVELLSGSPDAETGHRREETATRRAARGPPGLSRAIAWPASRRSRGTGSAV